MIRGIDHIVIAVRDLAQAADDYRQAGFTVTPGGEHTGGATHNALVSFADGAYFELIAFKEPDRPQEHKWWAKLSQGEGTVDYALLSDGLEAEARRLRQAGVHVDGPRDGGRERPDGQRIAWRTIGLEVDDAPLPFLIEDITARELRVPIGAVTEHPLGITGVAGLSLLVADLDRARGPFEAILGTPGESSATDIAGVRRAQRFNVGPHWIDLAEADPAADELQKHITERGVSPYEIVLTTTGAAPGTLPLNQTHAARIRLEPAG
jgi:catechol 2,3-dioxygenase-like lactoylglutathione lyase family enzyme